MDLYNSFVNNRENKSLNIYTVFCTKTFSEDGCFGLNSVLLKTDNTGVQSYWIFFFWLFSILNSFLYHANNFSSSLIFITKTKKIKQTKISVPCLLAPFFYWGVRSGAREEAESGQFNTVFLDTILNCLNQQLFFFENCQTSVSTGPIPHCFL